MTDGQTFESLFEQAYQNAVPEIQNASKQLFSQGDLSGYEITYRRPWGEPWWQFRDIWVERDAMIYVLSCHALPDSFDAYSDIFNQIMESFQFKE